jgi:hypothetical protein
MAPHGALLERLRRLDIGEARLLYSREGADEVVQSGHPATYSSFHLADIARAIGVRVPEGPDWGAVARNFAERSNQ